MKKILFASVSLLILFALFSGFSAAAEELLKPYILASTSAGTVEKKAEEVKAALIQQGFQIAGQYSPYKGALVLAATNDSLRKTAAKSDFGAYGAVCRISLTEKGGEVEVAYTNPLYYAQAYQMKEALADLAAALEKALGKKSAFGSKKGMNAAKLRAYHYMIAMPYFEDQLQLGSFGSQEEALRAVEANLAAHKGGSSKVYRIDLPEKKETIIGVGLTEGEGADRVIMPVIDISEPKHTAHLPYELVISNGKVFMLHGKFRIALDFPDLTMGTFMKISGAPAAIEEKLKIVAGGK